jgi:glycosyltransferase involved in cell wall biosynthesis
MVPYFYFQYPFPFLFYCQVCVRLGCAAIELVPKSKFFMKTMPKIIFVVDKDWFFLSHRLPIALAAQKAGFEVLIVSEDTGRAHEIRTHGLRFWHVNLARTKVRFWNELKIIKALYLIYKKEQPDIVHHVTLKIVVNGTAAARIAGVKNVVNAVAGLGHFFINPAKAWIVKLVFPTVFFLAQNKKTNYFYIFHNDDDRSLFVRQHFAKLNQTVVIKGSGVDLQEFGYAPEPDQNGVIRVVLGTRLVSDKGIHEFVDAARALKLTYHDQVEFIIAGRIITENPTSIAAADLQSWHREGVINYIGYSNNMKGVLEDSHINVLPSYREGLPKSLIEACAVGRPIVTTNVSGCKDVVEDGVNGYLVPTHDAGKLAEALTKLIENKDLRIQMGRSGRTKAENEFSIDSVIKETMNVYANCKT